MFFYPPLSKGTERVGLFLIFFTGMLINVEDAADNSRASGIVLVLQRSVRLVEGEFGSDEGAEPVGGVSRP